MSKEKSSGSKTIICPKSVHGGKFFPGYSDDKGPVGVEVPEDGKIEVPADVAERLRKVPGFTLAGK